MNPWSMMPAAGALVLLSACADERGFTQADLDRAADRTRCAAQADAARPIWNSRQLHSLPGQPRPMSLDYWNAVNRRAADCLAESSSSPPLRGRALDVR
ncbi:MAG TPA: hypothetical protein VF274_06070 [Alphaproteobacteria bacterium]